MVRGETVQSGYLGHVAYSSVVQGETSQPLLGAMVSSEWAYETEIEILNFQTFRKRKKILIFQMFQEIWP